MPNPSQKTNELRLVSYCPVCESRSSSVNVQTLGSEGETHLLHTQCQKCQNAFLSLVLVNQIGATSVGLLTDLSYDDVHRFHHDQSVNINDVIKTHTLFSQKDFLTRFTSFPKKIVKTREKRIKRNVHI